MHIHYDYEPNKPFYESKKWWTMAIGVFIPMINQLMGWQIDLIQTCAILLPVIAYLVGQSWVDATH